jgi:choice-of-anchor A domain-containing protein
MMQRTIPVNPPRLVAQRWTRGSWFAVLSIALSACTAESGVDSKDLSVDQSAQSWLSPQEQADQAAMASVSSFNVVVTGDAAYSCSDFEGPTAIGGDGRFVDMSFNAMGVGDHTWVGLDNRGALDFQRGTVHGSLLVGHGAALDAVEVKGFETFGSSVDHSELARQLVHLSDRYAALAATGRARLSDGYLNIASGDQSCAVFDLTAGTLAAAGVVTVNAPAHATVIINVRGADARVQRKDFRLQGGISKDQVLFNFVDATALRIERTALFASVLAPKAATSFFSGRIEGQLLVASLDGEDGNAGKACKDRVPGGQVNWGGNFIGALPVHCALPDEPERFSEGKKE